MIKEQNRAYPSSMMHLGKDCQASLFGKSKRVTNNNTADGQYG